MCSEANWGSSAQAQVFVSALKGVQSLTETQEHVKNYRPKVRIICERSEGSPVSHRDTGTRQELQTKGQDQLWALW
jgi:hypothetical protein